MQSLARNDTSRSSISAFLIKNIRGDYIKKNIMGKSKIVLLIILLALVPSFAITVEAGNVYRKLVVVNNTENFFKCFYLTLNGSIRNFCMLNKYVACIDANKSSTVELRCFFPPTTFPGNYSGSILADGKIVDNVTVSVEQRKGLAIEKVGVEKSAVKPYERVKVCVSILNFLNRSVNKTVVVLIDGKEVGRKEVTLAPLSRKKVEVSVKIPSVYGSKEIVVLVDGERRKEYINVLPLRLVKTSRSESFWLFFKKGRVVAENYGNVEARIVESLERDMWLLPVIFSNKRIESGSKIVATVFPGESVTIEYTEIFVLPFIIVAALVLLVTCIYHFYPWEVSGRKVVKRGDGEIGVVIEVKARKEISSVTVKDRVPRTFKLVKKFEFASPRIKEKEDYVELVWKIRKMVKGEERVLHYKIKPEVEVEDVELPRASVEARAGKKVIRKKL